MRNRSIINAGFLLLGLLFFIWPIPGTISIRDISIFLLFIIFAFSAGRAGLHFLKTKEPRAPFTIMAILTLWIVLAALFISKETAWSLKEIQGQWLVSLVVFITAALAALSTAEGTFLSRRNVMTLLFAVLMAHIIYIDMYAVYIFAKTSALPTWVYGLTGGKDKSSYVSHFLLMMLCVEIYFRKRQGKGYLPINNGLLIASLLLTLFSIHLEAVRNGTVAALLLLFAFTFLYFSGGYGKLKRLAIMSSVILLLLLLGYASSIGTKSEQLQRWRTFLETVPLALDTGHYKAWLNRDKYPYPKLKNGEPVSGSNYERVAWFKEGVVMLIENPLGVGFGRNAFGHALNRKYPGENAGAIHSHSGILDFSIGTGIPGLLMWLLFLMNLMYASLKRFLHRKSYFGLLLFFITVDFAMRMLVDSIIRDHMLQMFLFFAGLLYILMFTEKEDTLDAIR